MARDQKPHGGDSSRGASSWLYIRKGDLAWAPTLGLRLNLALDGLAALYALLATVLG
jgi:NADH:ubiquinone oxidoreductase subunit 4 (subunit M)